MVATVVLAVCGIVPSLVIAAATRRIRRRRRILRMTRRRLRALGVLA